VTTTLLKRHAPLGVVQTIAWAVLCPRITFDNSAFWG